VRPAVSDPDRKEVIIIMRKLLLVLTLAGISAGAVAAFQRSDCPGTRVCPLTGCVVCVDRCPVQK
jgi:hypothetical protein